MSDVTFIERDIYIHAHTEDPAENATRKTTRKKLFAALGAGALLAGGGWYAYDALVASKHVVTDNANVGAGVAQVTSQVAGPVSAVQASDTRAVKRGDVLAVLDDTDARLALARAADRRRADRGGDRHRAR